VNGPPPTDPRGLRAVLGRFATGVTIVTCADADGAWVGLTVNSFNALSLEPPLVLWSLRETSASMAAFSAASHFSVSVLAESQLGLSRRFAAPGDDKFGEGDWRPGLGGAPVLDGAAAVLECALHLQQPAGDHRLFIGRIERLSGRPVPPLVYQGGHYHALGERL
jgi:3-hydroxy-9,10-secoandrosta-1,3,5(10)-triene-9,17-dione monooxygenase reductase component